MKKEDPYLYTQQEGKIMTKLTAENRIKKIICTELQEGFPTLHTVLSVKPDHGQIVIDVIGTGEHTQNAVKAIERFITDATGGSRPSSLQSSRGEKHLRVGGSMESLAEQLEAYAPPHKEPTLRMEDPDALVSYLNGISGNARLRDEKNRNEQFHAKRLKIEENFSVIKSDAPSR